MLGLLGEVGDPAGSSRTGKEFDLDLDVALAHAGPT
jgi:hypothetical protein